MAKTFYFAWVNPGTAFDASVHNVEDEEIISFTIEQLETEFATLTIDIRNPRIGLLSAGRKIWAWLSWNNAGTIVPLFFGRVIGVPSSINKEVVTLQFVARPIDYGAQKLALAATMRALPFYDPIFVAIDKRDDPDVVLEARTQVWHINRTTHLLTTSDLIVGEEGVEEFQESEVPYDSVDVALDQPPIRVVHLEADVSWNQVVSGKLPAFRDMHVQTVAKGLLSGWPVAGANLGGGWSVAEGAGGEFGDFVITGALSPQKDFTDAEVLGYQAGLGPGDINFISPQFITSLNSSVSNSDASLSVSHLGVINFDVFCSLSLAYEATRQRKDLVTFDLIADSQAIVTLPDGDDSLDLKVSSVDVSEPLDRFDLGSEIPIGNSQRRTYFRQTRGHQSIQYLLQLARASIVLRSRAVRVRFECRFERAVNLSLRKNALLHDHRLPGGQALGKIVGYIIRSEGGKISGEVTAACAIGYGGAVVANPGVGVYANAGYMNDGYQFRAGQTLVSPAGDVAFTLPSEQPNDDGFNFPLSAVPWASLPVPVITNPPGNAPIPTAESQGQTSLDDCGNTTTASVSMTLDTGPYTQWLGKVKASIDFALNPVTGGPFETTYPLVVTTLKLPKQIDLEAPSS